MRKLIYLLALFATPAVAGGYTAADAAYVTSSRDPDVLNYIVCLASKADGPDQLEAAEAACSDFAVRLTKPDEPKAQDIMLMIRECGFRPGEGSPEMGCEG